ncbi:MAG: neutral/alkaline non-lysosomal ceramidase N-terminal domain-containing protein [Candidatus Hydrogenedentes bacterium]|nr:neutral/alkaline non-lysosomal ceramidase N-terminal domain-containing protein [Candidatus Hydrogenedentota bacterium]
MLKKILLGAGIVLALLVLLIVTFVGPWPTYASSDVTREDYFREAALLVDKQAAESSLNNPGPLQAGWGSARLTPPVGTPLAGFGDREGKPSTGIHDELEVKAVALSDGKDTVVLVGSDMLIVPDNIANAVRAQVAEKTGLSADDILFNASHTHSGPGAWGPGVMASLFAGSYNDAIVAELALAFASAIGVAHSALAPASIAHGSVDAPEYIRNRARDTGTVDSQLSFLVLRRQDGKECHVVSYSAHATVLGGSNMEFSGDYPGYLKRAIETRTGGTAVFLSGAVGSMSPQIEGADGFERAQAMGEALAQKVLEGCEGLTFQDSVDIASVGFAFETPPMQLRLSQEWRLSPYLLPLLGVDDTAWVTGVRIGDVFLYGTPCDMSGEISRELKQWARNEGLALWVLSFDGDYVGYISPYKYYSLSKEQTYAYEMYVMSWLGPNQEAFFTELLRYMCAAMRPGLVES